MLTLVWSGRTALCSPAMFLGLVTLGNLAAIVLAYTVVPASAAEFPWYMRATIDRLLLHIAPTSGLLLAAPLASGGVKIPETFNFLQRGSRKQALKGK